MAKRARVKKRARKGKPQAKRPPGGPNARLLLTGLKQYHQELVRRSATVQVEMSAVASAIEAMGAAVPTAPAKARPGPRPRGGSLKEFIVRVLASSPGPMSVKQIGTGVVRAGYRTKSKSLGNQVSMGLTQMAKKRQIRKVSRGMYRA